MPTNHDPEHGRQEVPSRLFRDDTRFALGRIAAFQYLAVGIFLLLISGFWILQVRDHDENSEAAERNRIKTVPLPAPRGKILDRDGRVTPSSPSTLTRSPRACTSIPMTSAPS
jgi:penicillin-binding protein 2